MGMIKNRIRTFLLSGLLLCSGKGIAVEADNVSITGEAGVSLNSFNYRELAASGEMIDKETGLLPGLLLGIKLARESWALGAQLELQRARSDYDGQSSAGRALSTRTDEAISNATLRAGKNFSVNRPNDLGLYVHTGLRKWRRDIASVDNVSGLYEIYRWWYVGLGANAALYQNGKFHLDADINFSRLLRPSINVDFRDIYDKPDALKLPATTAWRVALPLRYQLNPASALRIEPYAHGWNISRSAIAPLYRNGVAVGIYTEPASETRLYGVQATWQQLF
jgi:hypothetical protein